MTVLDLPRLISQPGAKRGTLKTVTETRQMLFQGSGRACRSLSVAGVAALIGAGACAQQSISVVQETLPQAPSALVRPLVHPLVLRGGVKVEQEQPGEVQLTLDDAVRTALEHNTELVVRTQQEKYVHGQVLTVGNALAPNLAVKGYLQAQEIDLAAQGFKPGTLANVKFNGASVGPIASIVKVNTANVQVAISQALFNIPAFYLYRAARKAVEASQWATRSARGGVVIAVGGLYLRTLADEAQVLSAEQLVKQDQVVFDHAKASKDAGVGINLDLLRAGVQLANERQSLVRSQNAVAKDKINLNREMGQPAGQELNLVDAVPFAEFDEMPLGDAVKLAYENRKDLRGFEAQLEVATEAQKAVKFERVPTLGVGGFYGVIGEIGGLYHGNFVAQGQLSVPVFEEAALRGQKEVANAQTRALRQQIQSTKESIEGQIQSSMLDVQSSRELVKVARSNVELAQQALDDAAMRFTSGIDDSLPVVQAQATLVGAETQVVEAAFQYNYAKLGLARNTGVVETQYRQYLGH